MSIQVLYYSDIENAYDDPGRVGRLAGVIDDCRDDRTVVAGTGDNTAPGVLALRADGKQSLDFFEAVEPDIETFGNHCFDFGTEPLRKIVAESPQQWLTANVYEDPDRRFADADPTAVVERDGERVGFVGVTDPKTPEISAGASDLTVTDPVAAVRKLLPDLRERTDYVVLLAHLREDNEHEIAALDGVDAVLGGHVHSERHERVHDTLLLRPGANGQVVWAVELGGDGGGATATRHAVPDGPRDDAVAEALRDRMEATGLTEAVTTVAEPIHRESNRHYGGECRLANFVTDAYRWATGADVGFTQSGGLRDGPPLSGEVTVADLVGVSPFDNELQTVAVTGAELREIASDIFMPDHPNDRIWWGHFSGLSVSYDSETGRICELRRDGDRIDPDREYTLATNDFVVQHDVGPITSDRVLDTWGIHHDAIVGYAREEGLDVELDGRLKRV